MSIHFGRCRECLKSDTVIIMRLLVIGGCGFLGCNFIRYVLGHYHAEFITNVDAEIHPGNHQNLNEVPAAFGERYEFFHTDIRSAESMAEILSHHRYFAVIHFASQSSVSEIQSLIETAARHRVKRIVHVVSGAPELIPPLVESTAQPLDIESMVLTSGSVYGPNQWALAPLPTRIRRILEGASSATGPLQDWLHVDDLCSAIMSVMLEGEPGEIYSVGPDDAIPDTVLEEWILSAVERSPTESNCPTHPLPAAVGDSSKLRGSVHWRPIVKPRDGIRDVVRWYLYYRARLIP
jgi:dTDP-glucose 4,6-dehydratase